MLRRGTRVAVPEDVGEVGDPGSSDPAAAGPGPLGWDEVVEVADLGSVEPVFDLEVRPDGRRIENFVAGVGGVFVSNTAGFIDPGFDGHLTLELSNVANLPITVYPGMKIGQISFLQMTTPADAPYGSVAAGSRYQNQRGPTPSRFHENFNSGPAAAGAAAGAPKKAAPECP
ncbi:MAG: dCTP deaminase domain-containing protein [Acidimicrobiales bacterium]